ncbi:MULTISPECIES: carbon-nitrogen hydrolase [Marinobacter]|jgi:N-carbamoylputrescine amidase|uniref:carbon-nitrogen hydrolase n=1 Tax=Marinobacter TaxID=2742 RepID=UPI000948A878|nr:MULTISPECIES: carbon-nitrogen hydrolase [Marinobacter]MAB50749.1 acyltransferase [Marinobacter sp.]MBJ7300850.1 carbon-nitrogen hydrolase [Marinobacter salarius]MDC8455767.1 carbon-nitrogen hydrolase [Marinobacter sp. DS40M6]MDM8178217.1 carbon-nitrogen hydrolase [Marinobacter salarius]MDP4532395.1 carbon-nitrogen hydrolase [Marinobacter salarius]|tara:strand:+ start:223 stop:1146 length:924 start_codon:yes stop_codon:yes gene_type:complete
MTQIPQSADLAIAAIQQQCSADKDTSLATSERLIRQAATDGAQLVVLQELHATLYFCQTEDTSVFELAEPIPGPTSRRLSALAAELGIVLVGSIFERRMNGVYHNTAVVFERDGNIAGLYRKMHIPDDPGFYEKFYFTPGDASFNDGRNGFTPIDTSVGRLGVLVCWDQWYPEAARLMALAGAEVLIYPTAIGWDVTDDPEEQARQLDAWVTVQRGHAVANNLPVIAPNRVGTEPDPSGNSDGIRFWGNSFICGPQGEFLARADDKSETLLSATINRSRSESIRRIWPYFRDRRIDAYGDILKRVRD